jgi:hypothetical protein
MGSILARLTDILRLRSGPQDMPAGWIPAILASLAYLAQGFWADRIFNESDTSPRSLLAITVQFLIIAAILNIKQLKSRLPQTLTTLAGAGLIFGFISIFLVHQADPEAIQPLLALMWLALFLWSLAVDANIYRHALSITMSLGMLLAVLIFAATFILIQTVFG